MIFDPMTRALYSDDGGFLKTVDCPLALRPEQLLQSTRDNPNRFCNACKKTIRCIDDLADSDVKSALSKDESQCVFSTSKAKNIVFLRPIGISKRNHAELPIVQTARSLEAMADWQTRGFRLVFKSTGEGSTFGAEKYVVYQHTLTGRLWWSGDYRNESPQPEIRGSDADEWKMIRDWFFVRPDRPFPLAAYVVPKDFQPGARVFLEDVIEDVLETVWNQGNAKRILSSPATWNGVDFLIDEPMDLCMVG